MFYDKILRPLFFKFDAEDVHHFFNRFGEGLGRYALTRALTRLACRPVDDPILRTSLAGIQLKHPLGVGAGFDKEGRVVPIMQEVGFAYEEIGTITGRPSPGNPRPRLWRLPEDRALIVNYGLVSTGTEAAVNRFTSYRSRGRWTMPVGISVAKANVPNLSGEDGLKDLFNAYQRLEPFADYMTINTSCPNTADGHQYCQDPGMYRECLAGLDVLNPNKPVFIKLSPDISTGRLLEIMAETDKFSWVKGFILCNLTHDRSSLQSGNLSKTSAGGVSGAHLRELSDRSLEAAYKNGHHRYEFIGMGGIDSVEHAYRKIRLGATALQIVTSLIYNGPLWPSQLMRGLADRLKQDGFKNVKQAVGADVK